MERYPPAFVLGANGCNSLNIARAFGRRGISTYVFGDQLHPLDHIASRYVRYVRTPKLRNNSDDLAMQILHCAENFGENPVLFPVNDSAVYYSSKYRYLFNSGMHLPFSPWGVISILLDKGKFHTLLDNMGIPGPVTIIPNNINEALVAARKIGYPCIIKPAFSPEFSRLFLSKCLYIRDEIELNCFWKQAMQLNTSLMLQEIIPGGHIEGWMGYYDSNSKLKAYCPYIKKRQFPVDFGVGTFFSTKHNEQLKDIADQLLRRIGYHGLVDVEFKFDPRDSVWKMIEINARSCMLNSLADLYAVQLEYVAYKDAMGLDVDCTETPDRSVGWTETHKDFASAFSSENMSFAKWMSSRRGKNSYAYFCWDDPVPALLRLPEAVTAIASVMTRRLRWRD